MAINKMVLLVPIRHRRSRGYDEWRTTAYVAIGGIYVFRTAACAAPGGISGSRTAACAALGGTSSFRTAACAALGGTSGFRTAACVALGGTSGFRCQNRGLRYHFVAQIPGNTCDWAQRMSQGTMNRSLAVDRF